MNELQNSTKFIMDSVVQTLETVSAQQEQLNRALMLMQNGAWTTTNGGVSGSTSALPPPISARDVERLHSDLGIVKSLLLNQSQFPPAMPLQQHLQGAPRFQPPPMMGGGGGGKSTQVNG